MLKTIVQPGTGARYKMGRRRSTHGHLHMGIDRFLNLSTLPAPPDVVHYSYKAESAISQLYGNDKLSDCVVAGMGHAVGVFTGNAGEKPAIFTGDEITSAYSAISGYVPGDEATDNGCDMVTALQHWQKVGLTSEHKIQGWLAVKPEQVRLAIWLFEVAFTGLCLPDAWLNPMPEANGFTWGVAGAPDQENGHCTVWPGYNKNGVQTSTWGMMGTITDKAVETYGAPSAGGEIYAVFSQEILDRAAQKAPSGFDLEQLVAYFNGMGGNLVLPA